MLVNQLTSKKIWYISSYINIDDFKELIERSGFKFEDGEFENLIKYYFRNKEEITLEEFKMFAKGECVKLVEPKKWRSYKLLNIKPFLIDLNLKEVLARGILEK